MCKIKELDLPLGVNLKGTVTGLDITYELTDEALSQFNLTRLDTLSMHSSNTTNSLLKRSLNLKTEKRFNYQDNIVIDRSLKSIEFKNLKVNRPHSIKFIIKNLSGISTYFSLESKNFNPGIEKDLKYNISNNTLTETMTNKFGVTINNELSTTKNFNSLKKHILTKNKKTNIGHELLNDNNEQINFTSTKGNEFTKMRQIEKDSVLYLSSKKGVAVIIEPKNGKLEPYTENLITVSIYNECVGDFEDELIANIKGLPERRFPINLKIRGNPLQLAPFQPGIDSTENPPILKMGYVTTNVNNITKNFKVINSGTNRISLDWRIFDYDDVLNPKADIFKVKISEIKSKDKFILNFNAIEPEEVKNSNYYSIEPKNVLIQPKGTQDLNVTFNTDIEGLKSALLVAYPKFLDDVRTANVKLSELALRVDAHGVKPDLIVDKKVNKINFYFRWISREIIDIDFISILMV